MVIHTFEGVVALIVDGTEKTLNHRLFVEGTTGHYVSLHAGLVDIEVTVVSTMT